DYKLFFLSFTSQNISPPSEILGNNFIYFKHTTHTPTIRYTYFVVSNVFQTTKIAVPRTPPRNTTDLNSMAIPLALEIYSCASIYFDTYIIQCIPTTYYDI